MTTSLDLVGGASVPLPALALLADLRGVSEVRVVLAGERAWLRWPPGDENILRRVLPIPDVELYVQRDGAWYRHGRHLPSSGLPLQETGRPLHSVIFPAPVQPELASQEALQPCRLCLVRDDRPRKSTAMMCGMTELRQWADLAPTAQLAAIQAARCGSRVLLLGAALPLLVGGERFWGGRILVPLGLRPEPALPENALAEALGSQQDGLLVLSEEKTEVIPCSVFAPLTRAGVRLAAR